MSRLPTGALLLALSLACGDKDEDAATDGADGSDSADGSEGSDGGDATDAPPSDALLLPDEGSWDSSAMEIVENSCDFGGGGEGVVVIEHYAADQFTITSAAGDVTTLCTAELGGGFACEAIRERIEFGASGIDALTTLVTWYSGAMRSSTEGSVDVRVELVCAGTDCELLAELSETTIPCELTGQLDITWAE